MLKNLKILRTSCKYGTFALRRSPSISGGSIIAIKWETHKQPRAAGAAAAGTSQERGRESANETCGIKTTMRRKCYVARRANGPSFVGVGVGGEMEMDAESVGRSEVVDWMRKLLRLCDRINPILISPPA